MSAEMESNQAEKWVLPPDAAHALWAGTYDNGLNPLLALEERTMVQFLPALQGKRVLDLACGTGRWLERLLQHGPLGAVGIDFSNEMLGVAAAKPLLKGKFARAHALGLPIKDRSIDLTICSFALSYIPDLRSLATEVARVSTPGAIILISDFHPEGYERGWKRSFRFSDRVIEIASFNRSIEKVRETFECSGFRLVNRAEPSISEAEREIFALAGKTHIFDSVSRFPAIFILQFEFRGGGQLPELEK